MVALVSWMVIMLAAGMISGILLLHVARHVARSLLAGQLHGQTGRRRHHHIGDEQRQQQQDQETHGTHSAIEP